MEKLGTKRPQLLGDEWLLHQDSAPIYMALLVHEE